MTHNAGELLQIPEHSENHDVHVWRHLDYLTRGLLTQLEGGMQLISFAVQDTSMHGNRMELRASYNPFNHHLVTEVPHEGYAFALMLHVYDVLAFLLQQTSWKNKPKLTELTETFVPQPGERSVKSFNPTLPLSFAPDNIRVVATHRSSREIDPREVLSAYKQSLDEDGVTFLNCTLLLSSKEDAVDGYQLPSDKRGVAVTTTTRTEHQTNRHRFRSTDPGRFKMGQLIQPAVVQS